MEHFLVIVLFLVAYASCKFEQIGDRLPHSTYQHSVLPPCPSCGSHHTIKNGSTYNGKPKRECKDCGHQFVIDLKNFDSQTLPSDIKQHLQTFMSQ